MEYNIQSVIECLQKFQKGNADIKLVGEGKLLSLLASTHNVNCIDSHIERLKNLPGYDLYELEYFVNISSASRLLKVERATIYKWIREGVICSGDLHHKYVNLSELLKNLETIRERRM